MMITDTDRAKAAEVTARCGFHDRELDDAIAAALAEARAPYDRPTADLRALAEDELDEMADSHSECGPDHKPCLSQLAEDIGQRLRAIVAAAEPVADADRAKFAEIRQAVDPEGER